MSHAVPTLRSSDLGGTVATAGQTQIFVRQLDARAGTRFHLQRNSLSDVLEDLSDRLTIAEQGKQSGVIGIDFQDYSAERAAAVIRHIEDGYLRQNVERRSAEAQQSLEFLQQQLPEIRKRVDAAQAKLDRKSTRLNSSH